MSTDPQGNSGFATPPSSVTIDSFWDPAGSNQLDPLQLPVQFVVWGTVMPSSATNVQGRLSPAVTGGGPVGATFSPPGTYNIAFNLTSAALTTPQTYYLKVTYTATDGSGDHAGARTIIRVTP
jgi:hypothetical protein